MKLSSLLPALRVPALAVSAACTLASAAAAHEVTNLVFGNEVNHAFGIAVARIGDLNGDGYPEYLVGAPAATAQGSPPGAAYVIDGRYHYAIRSHSGIHGGSRFGQSVEGGFDWNLDGVPDYAVGAPRTSVVGLASAGMVRIFSGKDGSILQTYFGTRPSAHFGEHVAVLGDLDNDGRLDLAVGAPGHIPADGSSQGLIRVYSGATGLVLRDFTGDDMTTGFGTCFTSVGDWNGDGVLDIAIGLPLLQDHEQGPGVVIVRSGASGGYIATAMAVVADSSFARSLTTIADRDGDGRRELVIGAPTEFGIGAAHVYSSATKSISFSVYGQASGGQFGRHVLGVGDIDGDGREDFAVTAPLPDSQEALRVFSGANGQSLWAPLMKPAGSSGFMGGAIALMGDADGDGWLDVIIGDSNHALTGFSYGSVSTVRLALHQPSLGFAGPGNSKLSVHGKPLTTGGHADVLLTTAGANRPGVLVASPWQSPTPIFGGTLVPTLDGLLIPYVTDANGKFQLKGIPGGLGLFSIYCQAVTKNPSTPQGWGFSNAVRVDFAP